MNIVDSSFCREGLHHNFINSQSSVMFSWDNFCNWTTCTYSKYIASDHLPLFLQLLKWISPQLQWHILSVSRTSLAKNPFSVFVAKNTVIAWKCISCWSRSVGTHGCRRLTVITPHSFCNFGKCLEICDSISDGKNHILIDN